MKKINLFTIVILLLLTNGLHSKAQNVKYALPMTSLSLEVDAVQEQFYAGPYAKYAEKLLGITVPQEDKLTFKITEIKLTPYVEADHGAQYSIPSVLAPKLLKFTQAGLISATDAVVNNSSIWRFPLAEKVDFASKGVTSASTSVSSVLYANAGADFSKVSVQQEVLVKKTELQKAAEIADQILAVRQQRYNIVIGNTDATYSGAAMGAAIEELTRLEHELMSLFVGYTVTRKQSMSFDVVPSKQKENQMYVAFRISDVDGLLPSDVITGKPIILEINDVPEFEEQKELGKQNKNFVNVHYRTPAICTVKVLDGIQLLFQSRIPIFQLGEDCIFPVSLKG